jgi:hypothetical protein
MRRVGGDLRPVDGDDAEPHEAGARTQPQDLQPHPIVEVRLPTDRLLVQRLPPHVNVERLLSGQNCFELALQLERRGKAYLRSETVAPILILLARLLA